MPTRTGYPTPAIHYSALSLASAGSVPDDPINISSQYETADDGSTSDGEKVKSPEEELGKHIIFSLRSCTI